MPKHHRLSRRAIGASLAVLTTVSFGIGQVAMASLAPRPLGIEIVSDSATALRQASRINLQRDASKPIWPIATTPRCLSLNNYGDARSNHVHIGLDIMATLGQPVYAVVDGTLVAQDVFAGTGTAGNTWRLQSATGSAYYVYMHLDGFAPDLKIGSRVTQGQVIAYVGSTGNYNVDNNHLHFEVHPTGTRTVTVDPVTVLTVPDACKP